MAHHVHFRNAILRSQLPDVLTDSYHIEALEPRRSGAMTR
jgi:hypothetical protein